MTSPTAPRDVPVPAGSRPEADADDARPGPDDDARDPVTGRTGNATGRRRAAENRDQEPPG